MPRKRTAPRSRAFRPACAGGRSTTGTSTSSTAATSPARTPTGSQSRPSSASRPRASRHGSEAAGNAQSQRQGLDRMEMLVGNADGLVELWQPRLVEVSDLVSLGVEQIECIELDANAVV